MNISKNSIERRRKEDRLRWMVESTPNALLMVNCHGKIVLVNSKVESLFGYTRTELVGMSIEQLIPAHARGEHTQHRDGYFHKPTARPMGVGRDLYGLRKDGIEIPVEIGLNPMNTEEGIFVVASIIDISERKKTELAAAQLRQELAHLSRVELASQFSGSLAHELNQPLSAMLTNSQVAAKHLAKQNPDIGELRLILDDIIADNRRARDIVIRLRGWLKKDDRKLVAQNINTLIEETLHFLKSELIVQKMECSLDLKPNLPHTFCDKIQIQQVLVNLIKNAWESPATKAKDARHILIRTDQAKEGFVRVEVHDDGAGISNEFKNNLFHPFMSSKPTGLGMGLSICLAIIEGHGGKIWADNNQDGGATFRFILPIATSNPT